MKNSSLSERLKSERLNINVRSQAEMAELVGISREMWGKYERGIAMPGSEVLIKLAKLGFDVGFVLTGKSTSSISDEEVLFLSAWRKADFLTKHKALQLLYGESDDSTTPNQLRNNFEGANQTFQGSVKNVAGRDINNVLKKKKNDE